MTRTVRVSEIKKNRPQVADGKPGEGTKARNFYDALRRGEVVAFGSGNGAMKRHLEDMYGMDIEAAKSDTGRIIGSRLVGEWDGPYYIPVERIVSSLMEPV